MLISIAFLDFFWLIGVFPGSLYGPNSPCVESRATDSSVSTMLGAIVCGQHFLTVLCFCHETTAVHCLRLGLQCIPLLQSCR